MSVPEKKMRVCEILERPAADLAKLADDATVAEQIQAAKVNLEQQLNDVAYEDETAEGDTPMPTLDEADDSSDSEEPSDSKSSDSDKSDKTTEDKHLPGECPECACRKRKKTGGFPFGRDPADVNSQPKKPKEDPKTPWGKFQRQYAEKYKDLNSSTVTTAIARVYYVPVHSNGTETPKSLERLLRETHQFIQPWAKGLAEKEKAKSLREWTEGLLHNAIITHHIASHNRPPNTQPEKGQSSV
jgi:hypothetical protein